MGGDDVRSAREVVFQGSDVGTEDAKRLFIGFNKHDVRCSQEQSADAQDAVAGPKVNDHLSFEPVQLVNGQHPVGCKIAFRGVLLKQNILARVGRQF